MIFELFTTPKFLKLKKKTTKALQKQLDGNIEIISKNPDIGKLKKGDLAGVRVYKFRYGNDQILIAYRVDTIKNRIILYAFGTHENFYKKFKKYMRV